MNQEIHVFNKATFDFSSNEVKEQCYPYELRPFDKDLEFGNELKAVMLFHFGLWIRTEPEIEFSFLTKIEDCKGSIVETKNLPLWILFSKKSDRTKFIKWLEKYSKSFGDARLSANYFPPIPSGIKKLTLIQAKSGFSIDYSSYNLNLPEGFVEKWIWINKNCKKPVYVSPSILAFESNADATLYKLRWS